LILAGYHRHDECRWSHKLKKSVIAATQVPMENDGLVDRANRKLTSDFRNRTMSGEPKNFVIVAQGSLPFFPGRSE
jgi:hypothetical protein